MESECLARWDQPRPQLLVQIPVRREDVGGGCDWKRSILTDLFTKKPNIHKVQQAIEKQTS